jgi:hypothetical protein
VTTQELALIKSTITALLAKARGLTPKDSMMTTNSLVAIGRELLNLQRERPDAASETE